MCWDGGVGGGQVCCLQLGGGVRSVVCNLGGGGQVCCLQFGGGGSGLLSAIGGGGGSGLLSAIWIPLLGLVSISSVFDPEMDQCVCYLFFVVVFFGGGEGGVKFTSAVWSLLLVCLIPSVSSVPVCVSAYVCVFIGGAVHKLEGSRGSPFLTIPGLSCFQSWAVMCHRAAVRERGQDQKEISQVGT